MAEFLDVGRILLVNIPVALYWDDISAYYESNGLPAPDPIEWGNNSSNLAFLGDWASEGLEDAIQSLVHIELEELENL